MKMQNLLLKFPHLPEQIFQKLGDESLLKCREVATSWQDIIDDRNYPWLRIVEIPTILKKGNAYIHRAAETGQIETFRTAFSEEPEKNIKNENGETSFHIACRNGSFQIVQFLLINADSEINFNAKDNHCIDLNAKTKNGKTAFHLATREGHLDVIKTLMKNAAAFSIDLNAKSLMGATAFTWACFDGKIDVVKIFMENAATYGIDLNAKDNEGQTAFFYARDLNVVQIFMQNAKALNIDLNAKSKVRWTAFHKACCMGRLDVVKSFMENAATLNINLNVEASFNGMTPFHLACHNGKLDVVKIFLEKAAFLKIDLNIKALRTQYDKMDYRQKSTSLLKRSEELLNHKL